MIMSRCGSHTSKGVRDFLSAEVQKAACKALRCTERASSRFQLRTWDANATSRDVVVRLIRRLSQLTATLNPARHNTHNG